MSGDDIVCHWHGLGLIESDDGWSCPACTKPSNVKALLAEIERLRGAGDALADNLRRHVMACGVHDARQALAAWEEARRG